MFTPFPDTDWLAALRGWFAGLSSRAAVDRYLPNGRAIGASARGVIGSIGRQLIGFAQQRQRDDLVELLRHPVNERIARASAVTHAIELLRALLLPQPQITDHVSWWMRPRAARALPEHGILTLADLTVLVPHRRGWWRMIAGLGQTGARQIEAFSRHVPRGLSGRMH
jgi:hypothetical protein